jgi:anti-anti-sigma factor
MSRDEDGPPLRCELELGDDSARILPIGELDIDTVSLVEARLEDARAAGIRYVVLDLRGTTFIDSTGLHLILTWHRRARRERFRFGLVQGPEAVRRVIDVAGIARALPRLGAWASRPSPGPAGRSRPGVSSTPNGIGRPPVH